MKNIKYTLIFIVTVLILGTGCQEDFINLYPLDQANVGNSFVTPEDANLALMGVYDALQTQSYAQDMAFVVELVSDNSMTQPSRLGVAGANDEREFEFFLITDENNHIGNRWDALYKGIARANQVISRIEDIPFNDESTKAQYVGEAKFMRALFYFDLVRFFGGVPVSLNEIQSAGEAFELGRETEENVYSVIIQDLEDATSSLPVSYENSQVGRVTKGAAKALLAKVHLTNGAANLATPLLQELTSSPYSYQLMSTYASAFDTDNTAESIFEIQYTSSAPDEGNPYPQFFLLRDGSSGKDIFGDGYLGGNGNGEVIPTQDLWDAYEVNDPRRDYTIAKYYSGQEGDTIFRVNKYREAPTSPNNSEDNIVVLRYADVLLMLAESINESNNGPNTEAYDAIDEVRVRAGLSPVERTHNYESFKDLLLHERRVEFAFENHRWFDMKRFGEAYNIMSSKGYDIQQHHLLYPIPRREVEINDLIDQNPEY